MNHINSVYSLLDKKISYDKLLNLRAKFFSGQKLTRGELTEMMFGKTIPFIKTKTFSSIKSSASNDDIMAVVNALVGLQQHTLSATNRVDNSSLSE